MQTLNTTSSTKSNDIVYPKITHVYKAENGLWRGFMTPYDISFESKTKKEVLEVLPELINLYEEGLKKYGYPSHLSSVPLSNSEDLNALDKYIEDWKNSTR